MQPLTKSLRTTLENCIQKARDVSEEAAKASLEQLSVGDENAFSHLNTEDKELRRKLRTHGRQLGDTYNSTTKKQEISLLVEEVAYEHWHRMLFARFLAENDLLMYPDPKSPTAVSLADCEELAREQGVRNGWELAARFASLMLPQIFRISSPVFGIHFSLEYQTQLEKLLSDLPKEIFTASDSLGWVYQFWQSKRKDEINKSEVKIGSRELPSVTQLFTEPYMVSFLLDNSLGAWWANQKLNPTDLETATTEKELRSKAATSSMPLEYLRFVKRDTKWDLASGTFAKWPKDLRDFKVIDPCCGSGHFLVAVFLMLVAMRMDLEHLTAKEAIDLVFKENIHGLDIDKRVTEITAFALALTAWKYPDAGGYRPLPELNIACSGLAVGVEKSTWQKLAGTDTNLKTALGWLYDEFQNAPVLGSLLDPSKSDAAKLVKWDDLSSTLTRALEKEKSEEELEAGVVAQGLAKAGSMLTAKYHWVVTNVPYLARGKQSEVLKNFSERNYSEAKNDLATVFLDRTLDYCNTSGTASIVLPQNWLFLTSYKKFREKLLKQEEWNFVARLGAGAFETISGEVVKAILVTLSKRGFQPLSSTPNNLFPNTNAPIHYLRGIDVSAANSPTEKAEMLLNEEIKTVDQAKQLENPDARVAFGEASDINLLSRFSFSYQGISPADFPRFGRLFWEGS